MKKIIETIETVVMRKYYLYDEDNNGGLSYIDTLENEFVETIETEDVAQYTIDNLPDELMQYRDRLL